MFLMSEAELRAIRQRKMQELQKRLATKPDKTDKINADEVLDKLFKGRAWEVFNTATLQYPTAMRKLKETLVKLALSGRLTSVTGEQLYSFLRNLGLRVRLNTKIHFTEHGKLKSLSEKIRDDLRKV